MEISREAVLQRMAKEDVNSSQNLAQENQWDHQKLVGVIKSLEALSMITSEKIESESVKLVDEALEYLSNGTPEFQIWDFVQKEPASQAAINEKFGAIAKLGLGTAMKNKWIVLDKAAGLVKSLKDDVVDETRAQMQAVMDSTASPAVVAALKKRKLIRVEKITDFKLNKAAAFSTEVVKPSADITAEMMATGSWKNTTFRAYNLKACGTEPQGGHLHPLLKVRAELRLILISMGFQEMPTNKFVESSFWNFDTLFQPQQHPARDAHDTFFLKEPKYCRDVPLDYMERVKKMHEKGGHGSIGWRYDWSEEESRKNLLRTHTTAVSSRVLYQIGQEYKKTGVFVPRKCFSIDRVFRNETLDATHLAEFHQVEGFIIDRNLTIGHLMGVFREFFRRQGITNLRFKPAYNPYTEPSMEIFGFHPILDKWVEIGNSGMFRPEMLAPMGLPSDVSVIAWGLSVERPTMIQYGIANIRELFGYKLDKESLKTNPVPWMMGSADSVKAF